MFARSMRIVSRSVARTNVATRPVLAPVMLNTRRTVVTIEEAKKMPKHYRDMPNDALLTMAIMGDQEAREERLIREIMGVDNITWEQAQPTFLSMVDANRRGLFMVTLPYKVGITTAVVAAFASLPMIFDINTVLLFNDLYVTSGKSHFFSQNLSLSQHLIIPPHLSIHRRT